MLTTEDYFWFGFSAGMLVTLCAGVLILFVYAKWVKS